MVSQPFIIEQRIPSAGEKSLLKVIPDYEI
jgi:hypothetical protein